MLNRTSWLITGKFNYTVQCWSAVLSMLINILNSNYFYEGSHALPTCLLINAISRWRWLWSTGGMICILTEHNEGTQTATWRNVNLFTANFCMEWDGTAATPTNAVPGYIYLNNTERFDLDFTENIQHFQYKAQLTQLRKLIADK